MMNWDDIRFFLALWQERTLSGASRRLAVDPTTVGRRLTALEQELGAKLFERTPDGFVPTATGEAIRGLCETMETTAIALERQAAGQDTRLSGVVRLTTPEALANRFVVPELAKLHARHPDIEIELLPESRILDISRRQADVAVRVARPKDPELIARKIGGLALALYGTPEYLVKRSVPQPGQGLAGHDLVYYGGLQPTQGRPFLGESIAGARFTFRSNSTLAQANAVAAGLGIGVLPCYMAEGNPRLVRLWPHAVPEVQELWLAVHPDVRRAARVRAVTELLGELFRREAPSLLGKVEPVSRPRDPQGVTNANLESILPAPSSSGRGRRLRLVTDSVSKPTTRRRSS